MKTVKTNMRTILSSILLAGTLISAGSQDSGGGPACSCKCCATDVGGDFTGGAATGFAIPERILWQYNTAKLNWTIPKTETVLSLVISTNYVTNWHWLDYSTPKQVGTVQTNRVLTITSPTATNEVILDVLGIEEWPSQKRKLR